MEVTKTFNVAVPREQVWQFITSPTEVGPCMPGCEDVEETGPGRHTATLKVKVGPIKTSFKIEVTTTEERPPEFAAYLTKGEEGGRASRLNAESTLTLKEKDVGYTQVTYTSHIKLVGRLGKFAGGVMKKMADSMSDQFIAAIRQHLESPTEEDTDEQTNDVSGENKEGLIQRMNNRLRGKRGETE